MRTAVLLGVLVIGVMAGALRVSAREQGPRPADTVVDETQPVPVPESSPQALAYHRSGNFLWIADQLWSMAILIVVLATGFSARLRDFALRIGRKWFVALAIYFVLFTLITTIVDLPRAYYEEFVRQHAY